MGGQGVRVCGRGPCMHVELRQRGQAMAFVEIRYETHTLIYHHSPGQRTREQTQDPFEAVSM